MYVRQIIIDERQLKFHKITESIWPAAAFSRLGQDYVLWSTFSGAVLHLNAKIEKRRRQRRSLQFFNFLLLPLFGLDFIAFLDALFDFQLSTTGNLKCEWCCWLIWAMNKGNRERERERESLHMGQSMLSVRITSNYHEVNRMKRKAKK